MKIGDLIEVNGGHPALIIGREDLYPGHPKSPARYWIVQWISSSRPKYSRSDIGWIEKVSAFSVDKVISRA